MIFRNATIDDYSAVLNLYRGFSKIARSVDWPEPGGLEQYRAVLDHPGTSIIIAQRGDEIVAMATLHVLPNMTRGGQPYALIENVITAENHRRKGFGRRVMEETIETAWKAGVYKIMLLIDRNRLHGGVQGFYEKLGFSTDEKIGMALFRKV